tara:strand:+ start:581 stop:859 length:279 start_codon:yes stop_codon:yes gene_type:complete
MPKSICRIVVWALSPLSIPLIAMFITDEVQWSVFDFLIMGGILISFASIGNYIYTTYKDQKRTWLLYVLALVFLLLWIELAVGIFNSPIAGN